jgi:hypothetical protein
VKAPAISHTVLPCADVGQGGGAPHLHGDPFGSYPGMCLYSKANYSSLSAHPPQIGWSRDGYSIYGRYLSRCAVLTPE